MNTFKKGLVAITAIVGLSSSMVSTGAVAQEQQLPANYIDCSLYPYQGYADENGNDERDGVSERALARTPEENNARLCSGLPTYTGDERMPIMTVWDDDANILFKVFGDRPNGHQENGTTRMGWITYPNSPTPLSPTPLFAELATTTNGNATLGRAAASVLPSATNGMGTAVVNNLLSPCRNGRCNSGPSVINNNLVDGAESLAVNSATAASGSTANLEANLGGGCSSCAAPVVSSTTSTPQPANDNDAAIAPQSMDAIE